MTEVITPYTSLIYKLYIKIYKSDVKSCKMYTGFDYLKQFSVLIKCGVENEIKLVEGRYLRNIFTVPACVPMSEECVLAPAGPADPGLELRGLKDKGRCVP